MSQHLRIVDECNAPLERRVVSAANGSKADDSRLPRADYASLQPNAFARSRWHHVWVETGSRTLGSRGLQHNRVRCTTGDMQVIAVKGKIMVIVRVRSG